MAIIIAFAYLSARTEPPERSNVLTASTESRLETVSETTFSAFVAVTGELELPVMDFSSPMALHPPPDGWWHRQFLTRPPIELSFGRIAGRPALRLATDDSASMLIRFIDLDLQRYPLLTWQWLIEDPVDSEVDETTRAGDDHPARLFLRFRHDDSESRALEIIWGNELGAGDTKFIDGFPHYVANGGDANLGRWQDEEVDLLALYRNFWPQDSGSVRITDIGLFCDSDETGDDSVAWFAEVVLKQRLEIPGLSAPDD